MYTSNETRLASPAILFNPWFPILDGEADKNNAEHIFFRSIKNTKGWPSCKLKECKSIGDWPILISEHAKTQKLDDSITEVELVVSLADQTGTVTVAAEANGYFITVFRILGADGGELASKLESVVCLSI